MHRAKLVMNMTSMLDILIILFFAQAIEFKDKTVKSYNEQLAILSDNNKKLLSEKQELSLKVDELEDDNNNLTEKQNSLVDENNNLISVNEGLQSDKEKLSNDLKELRSLYNQIQNNFNRLKNEMHLVDDNLESGSIIKQIIPDLNEMSKEDATKKVIALIQTQSAIQKQTEKEIAIWIITLDNFYDKRDGKDNLILRLYISGKENVKFKKLSDKRPWNWGTPAEPHSKNLKEQLLAALNDKNIIPNSDIQPINIILCFQNKSNNNDANNQSSLLTPQIEAFAEIFKETFLELQEIYSNKQDMANRNGRGLGDIRFIPIPFDPRDIHTLDPELLIK